MPFDPETGRVFNEVLVQPRAPRPRSLSRVYADFPEKCVVEKSDELEEEEERGRGNNCDVSVGPRSLVDMLVPLVAGAIDMLEEEDFRGRISGTVGRKLWKFLVSKGMSLHAWKILQKLRWGWKTPTLGDYHPIWNIGGKLQQFPRGATQLLVPSSQDAGLNFQFSTLVKSLSSPTIDFISHLVIALVLDEEFTLNEMFILTDMKNLGVLEIRDPVSAEDDVLACRQWVDSLIRGWAEKDDPFPLLRILIVRSEHCTSNCLAHLARFPALLLFHVAGLRRQWRSTDSKGKEYGWERAKQPREGSIRVQRAPDWMDRGRERIASDPRPTLEDLVMQYLSKNDLADSLATANAEQTAFDRLYSYDGVMLIYDCLGLLIHQDSDLRARAENSPDRQSRPNNGHPSLPPRPMVSTYVTGRRTNVEWPPPRRSYPGMVLENPFDGVFIKSKAFDPAKGVNWGRRKPVQTPAPPATTGHGVKRKANSEVRSRKKQTTGNLLASLAGGTFKGSNEQGQE